MILEEKYGCDSESLILFMDLRFKGTPCKLTL
jgi:hypothetical protein